jgi:hypothetical protein
MLQTGSCRPRVSRRSGKRMLALTARVGIPRRQFRSAGRCFREYDSSDSQREDSLDVRQPQGGRRRTLPKAKDQEPRLCDAARQIENGRRHAGPGVVLGLANIGVIPLQAAFAGASLRSTVGLRPSSGQPLRHPSRLTRQPILFVAAQEPEPELVSRKVQASFGLFTGVMVYCPLWRPVRLFALLFAFAYGRVGNLSPAYRSYRSAPPAPGDQRSTGRISGTDLMEVQSRVAWNAVRYVGRDRPPVRLADRVGHDGRATFACRESSRHVRATALLLAV